MKVWISLFAALMLTACGQQPESESTTSTDAPPTASETAGEVDRLVVYSSRQPHLIEPLFQRYTAETGIEIDFTNDNEASLIERLAAEGENTPADVLVTVDAGNLWHAADRGLLRSIDSPALEASIPAALQDDRNRWFALSLRARTMVYHPERVAIDELSTYEDLADPRWQGRLCLRTSRKVYNQSLVAMLIEHHGEQRAEEIVAGWVANLATNPFSSDTQLIEAIAAGQCDVGIVNSYYLGRLQADNPDYPVQLFWANQGTTGVHVNVSGAGVTLHAPHPEQAQALIEWLASEAAQAEFAERNLEFPANPAVEARGLVRAWGEFRQDETPLTVAGQRQAQAVRLMDRVGYR
ncbi:extracellular solute-binding protein [Wenzhouxiangella marina]|uniref:Iron ABC transporter substrate-binding protein n=1 Tax=Wenzhouxiangella marina TaxID=1579979 RepID=A0A0K0XSY5_9GAMM|nr:extracellular solute-binding protein [Wenzhouxiangella marina]AKS40798.1 Iron ABC transporter substrate-binding protein [Wenzhouxiangella marina]MBB6087671.1 iron(III) transport system substrate-binding protein [Wenzhouxiangella marina]